jgi:guanine nucleotide-binding protein subunit alpha
MFFCCVKKETETEPAKVETVTESKKDPEVEKKTYRILLLGAGESGKSTILKQMRIIHKNGFTETEMRTYVDIIRSNLLTVLKMTFAGMEKLNIELKDPKNHPFKTLITKVVDGETTSVLQTDTAAEAISIFYSDEGVKEALARGSEYNLYDSAEYFLNRVGSICTPNYAPTIDDILHARTKTIGIVETSINIGKNVLIYVDIAGQRSERRKWIHVFDNAQVILFVAAISEYDQVLAEDDKANRVKEALELLDKVCNSRWFLRTSIILFLNKCDILKNKIQRVPISNTFPDYKGGPDFDSGRRFFRTLFMSAVEGGRDIYTHFTSATDTKACAFVLDSVHNGILNNALDKTITLA